MTDHGIVKGDVLASKYRVERVLGKGGMGVVVAATHIELGQLVALKLMLRDKEQTPELRERFLREARASVRLKSQHVARVLDVGTDEHDMPFIAMEFLEGCDLHDLLKQRGPLRFEDAAEYILQACEAVGEAHAAKIIHRDLKPANMFLTKDVSGAPCVKVLDFGISKIIGAELTLTQEAQTLGSPLYMSPEALGSAKNLDQRTDIWALGVILYQLVAGRTPFFEPTMGQLCTRILTGKPTPLAEYRTDAPKGFETVILRCLQRDRNDRYEHVAAFAHALAPYAPVRARAYVDRIARVMGVNLASLEVQSDPEELQTTAKMSSKRAPLVSVPGTGATSDAAVMSSTASASLSTNPFRQRSRMPLVIGAAVVTILAGGLLFALAQSDAPPMAAASAPGSVASAAPVPMLSVSTAESVVATEALPSASASSMASSASAPVVEMPAKPIATSNKGTNKPAERPNVPDYDERQ